MLNGCKVLSILKLTGSPLAPGSPLGPEGPWSPCWQKHTHFISITEQTICVYTKHSHNQVSLLTLLPLGPGAPTAP